MLKGKIKFYIGIDEAGRGPLAGPLIVAGVLVKKEHQNHPLLKGIKDSKQLNHKQRAEWYSKLIQHPDFIFATARITPATIDRINIYQSAQRGALQVVRALLRKKNMRGDTCHILLDGNLKLPKEFSFETIIKGDEKIPLISAASIIAKVTRDRIMQRIHKKYPNYRFDLHKGYGTELHRNMIKKYGRCIVHRESFGFDKN